MKLNNTLSAIFVIICQTIFAQINEPNNEIQKVLLSKIDSINHIDSENNKVNLFNAGKLYYDLFADEFDWYGKNDFDSEKANSWFNMAIVLLEKSANQKYLESYYSLASIYTSTPDYEGYDYKYNDSEKAIYWNKKLLAEETPENLSRIMYEIGLIYNTSFARDKEIKDNNMAYEWFEKAANSGNTMSMQKLGDLNYYGKGVPENDDKAFYWYDKCVKSTNFTLCNNDLAKMYYKGLATKQNYQKAYELFLKSAEKYGNTIDDRHEGDALACYYIGIMYYYGDYLQEDKKTAFRWIEKAAMMGIIDARSLLGYMHYFGQGTLIDKELAFTWLQYAESNEDSSAQYVLGTMYFYGEQTLRNKKKAAYWIKKSFQNGSDKAKEFWDANKLWEYK